MPTRNHRPKDPPRPRSTADIPAAPEPRHRRLSDKVRSAIHVACDEGAVEIALQMLAQLDIVIQHPTELPMGIDRRRPESLVAVRERVMNLMLQGSATPDRTNQ